MANNQEDDSWASEFVKSYGANPSEKPSEAARAVPGKTPVAAEEDDSWARRLVQSYSPTQEAAPVDTEPGVLETLGKTFVGSALSTTGLKAEGIGRLTGTEAPRRIGERLSAAAQDYAVPPAESVWTPRGVAESLGSLAGSAIGGIAAGIGGSALGTAIGGSTGGPVGAAIGGTIGGIAGLAADVVPMSTGEISKTYKEKMGKDISLADMAPYVALHAGTEVFTDAITLKAARLIPGVKGMSGKLSGRIFDPWWKTVGMAGATSGVFEPLEEGLQSLVTAAPIAKAQGKDLLTSENVDEALKNYIFALPGSILFGAATGGMGAVNARTQLNTLNSGKADPKSRQEVANQVTKDLVSGGREDLAIVWKTVSDKHIADKTDIPDIGANKVLKMAKDELERRLGVSPAQEKGKQEGPQPPAGPKAITPNTPEPKTPRSLEPGRLPGEEKTPPTEPVQQEDQEDNDNTPVGYEDIVAGYEELIKAINEQKAAQAGQAVPPAAVPPAGPQAPPETGGIPGQTPPNTPPGAPPAGPGMAGEIPGQEAPINGVPPAPAPPSVTPEQKQLINQAVVEWKDLFGMSAKEARGMAWRALNAGHTDIDSMLKFALDEQAQKKSKQWEAPPAGGAVAVPPGGPGPAPNNQGAGILENQEAPAPKAPAPEQGGLPGVAVPPAVPTGKIEPENQNAAPVEGGLFDETAKEAERQRKNQGELPGTTGKEPAPAKTAAQELDEITDTDALIDEIWSGKPPADAQVKETPEAGISAQQPGAMPEVKAPKAAKPNAVPRKVSKIEKDFGDALNIDDIAAFMPVMKEGKNYPKNYEKINPMMDQAWAKWNERGGTLRGFLETVRDRLKTKGDYSAHMKAWVQDTQELQKSKAEEAKATKTEEKKAEETKAGEQKATEPKSEEQKATEPKVEETKPSEGTKDKRGIEVPETDFTKIGYTFGVRNIYGGDRVTIKGVGYKLGRLEMPTIIKELFGKSEGKNNATWYGAAKEWTIWKLPNGEAPTVEAVRKILGDGIRAARLRDLDDIRRELAEGGIRDVEPAAGSEESSEVEASDMGGTSIDIGKFVSPETEKLIRDGGAAAKMPKEVSDWQVEDIALAIRAFENREKAFILANAPGSGKTYVLGGIIKELRKRGQKRIIYITTNQALIAQNKKDLADYGVEIVDWHSYAGTRGEKSQNIATNNAVIIYDEAHNIKNMDSQQGKAAEKMIRDANFTILSSATPGESLTDLEYIESTGVFDREGGFIEWAKKFGLKTRKVTNSYGKEIEVPDGRFPVTGKGLKDARKWLIDRGVYTNRPMRIPADQVNASFVKGTAEDFWVDLFDSLEDVYTEAMANAEAGDEKWIKGHFVNMQKRVLESAKADLSIAETLRLLDAGRRVVTYTDTVSDKYIGRFRKSGNTNDKTYYRYPEMVELTNEWAMMMAETEGRAGKPPFAPFIMKIAEAMFNRGIDHTLRSVPEETMEAVRNHKDGKYLAVEFTGNIPDATAKKNIAKWLSGEAKFLMASIPKGGTGLSLHDKVGDQPTAQVVAGMPWTATQMLQVLGRTARYGLVGDVIQSYIFSDNMGFDRKLARRLATRMKNLGALVQGIDIKGADKMQAFDFQHGEKAVMGEFGETRAEKAAKEKAREEELRAQRAEQVKKYRSAVAKRDATLAKRFPEGSAIRYILETGQKISSKSRKELLDVIGEKKIPRDISINLFSAKPTASTIDQIADAFYSLGDNEGYDATKRTANDFANQIWDEYNKYEDAFQKGAPTAEERESQIEYDHFVKKSREEVANALYKELGVGHGIDPEEVIAYANDNEITYEKAVEDFVTKAQTEKQEAGNEEVPFMPKRAGGDVRGQKIPKRTPAVEELVRIFKQQRGILGNEKRTRLVEAIASAQPPKSKAIDGMLTDILHAVFGGDTKLHWVSASEELFQGVTHTGGKDLFVNVNSSDLLSHIMFHERGHQQTPQDEADLIAVLKRVVDPEKFKDFSRRYNAGIGKGRMLNKEQMWKELKSELLAYEMFNPKFWQETAKQNGKLFRRLTDWIMKVFKAIGFQYKGMNKLSYYAKPEKMAEAQAALWKHLHKMMMKMPDASLDDVGMVIGDETIQQMVKVFHGGPHKIEGRKDFSLSKAGTGEGSAYRGWGAYFASKEEVADYYRSILSKDRFIEKFSTNFGEDMQSADLSSDEYIDDAIYEYGAADMTRREIELLKALAADDWFGFDYAAQAIEVAFANPSDGIEVSDRVLDAVKNIGYTYKAEINVNDDDLLDWDLPISKQPQKIQDILTTSGLYSPPKYEIRERQSKIDGKDVTLYNLYKNGIPVGFVTNKESAEKELENHIESDTGGSLYEGLVLDSIGDKKEAKKRISLRLKELGIPGIKFLDKFSRAKRKGTSNYVIFDENLIELTHRNDEEMSYMPSGLTDTVTKSETFGGERYDFKLTAYGENGSMGMDVYAADSKGNNIGGAYLKPIKGTKDFYIQQIDVQSDRRGKGIGKAIERMANKYIRQNGGRMGSGTVVGKENPERWRKAEAEGRATRAPESNVTDFWADLNYMPAMGKEYMDLAKQYKKGKTPAGVAAQLGQMVRAAAKSAGYTNGPFWHGTTHRFRVFTLDRANPENDWGKGHYFSSTIGDARSNYSEIGPDLESRIARRAEEIFRDDTSRTGWTLQHNTPEYVDAMAKARVKATDELAGPDRRLVEAFVKIDNPATVGGRGETVLTIDMAEDADEATGTLLDFLRNARTSAEKYFDGDMNKAEEQIISEAMDNGDELGLSRIRDLFYENSYGPITERGEYAVKEVIREALEMTGFDGIIDNTVGQRFNSMNGVKPDTSHIIAFKSNQIKMADPVTYDEKGEIIPLEKRFDQNNPDIHYMPPFMDNLKRELRETMGETKENIVGVKDEFRRVINPVNMNDPTALIGGIKRMAGSIRAWNAERANRNWIAEKMLRGYDKTIGKMTEDQKKKFLDFMEREIRENRTIDSYPELTVLPQATKDKLVELSRIRREIIEPLWQVVREQKGVETFIQDYFPHYWKDPQRARNIFAEILSKRPLAGSQSFLNKRIIDFIEEGLDAGLELETTDPIDNILRIAASLNRSIMAHEIKLEATSGRSRVWFLSHKNGRDLPTLKDINGRPIGWTKINDISALVGPKGIHGEYYAPDPIARIVNNFVSPGLMGRSKIYGGMRWLGNLMNSIQLGFSAFHFMFTTMDATVSGVGLGIQEAARGDIGKGLVRATKSVAFAPVELARIWRQGRKMEEEFLSGVFNDPRMAAAFISSGGRIAMDAFYKLGAVGQFQEAIRKGNTLHAIGMAPFAAIEKAMVPVMEIWVPRIKMGMFADMMQSQFDYWEKIGISDPSEQMIRDKGGEIWNSVENRMGQLAYDNLFWNKVWKDLAMISVRSVGWNLGTIREFGGAASDVATTAFHAGKRALGKTYDPNKILFTRGPNGVEISPRVAYAAAMPFIIGMIGWIIMRIFAGQDPEEPKDYFFPKTGRKRPDGEEERLSIPSYMKDIFPFVYYLVSAQPGKVMTMASHKMHPFLSAVSDIFTNSDYYGTEVRDANDPFIKQMTDAAKYIGEQTMPFSVRGALKATETTRTPTEAGIATAFSFAGLNPAPKYITMSKADEKMADYFATKRHTGISRETMEERKAKGKITQLLRMGRASEARQVSKEFGLTRKEWERQIKKSKTDARLNSFKAIGDVETAVEVYLAASKDERALYRRTLRNKINNSTVLNNREKQEFRRMTLRG